MKVGTRFPDEPAAIQDAADKVYRRRWHCDEADCSACQFDVVLVQALIDAVRLDVLSVNPLQRAS